MEFCGRCYKELVRESEIELCIGCEGALCKPCWESFGECGHPELEQLLEEIEKAKTLEERLAVLGTMAPIGSPRIKRRVQ